MQQFRQKECQESWVDDLITFNKVRFPRSVHFNLFCLLIKEELL